MISLGETGPGSPPLQPVPPARREVVRMHHLSKTFGRGDTAVRALDDVSLVIEVGDYVAIMGGSGSGKSTLMTMMGCLDAPTAGRYELDGQDVASLSDDRLADIRNQKIGFIFQSFNLLPRTSALRNVELPLVYARVGMGERRHRAHAALASVGLTARAAHRPSQLSGGQQQRVAVARALVTNPAVILADEPTGALDSHSTADILAVFDDCNARGRTVVIITHELEVARHAKRLLTLLDGRVVDDERSCPVDAPPPLWPGPVGGPMGGQSPEDVSSEVVSPEDVP